jgi:predicted nuclease with TOPRIM domain
VNADGLKRLHRCERLEREKAAAKELASTLRRAAEEGRSALEEGKAAYQARVDELKVLQVELANLDQLKEARALADRLRLRPGDEIDWQEAGDALRILPHRAQPMRFSSEMKLRLFDDATRRQRQRQARRRLGNETCERGWTREELYRRDRAD